jgi:O-acetyl-ADP-ribose deacetylase (regulator of RNase III)
MEIQKPEEEKKAVSVKKKASAFKCKLGELPAELVVAQGDITKIAADAIVNAANTGLLGGGGVDGAIHQVGGPAIMDACRKIRQERGGIATGDAVLTTGGLLPARFVIHTAGPVWHGGKNGESRLLAKCYRNSLLLADKHKLQHIAFSNISTGVYGFPKKKAAEIAIKTVCKYLMENTSSLKKVSFICFDEENKQLYQQLM